MAYDLVTYLPTDILAKVDRAAMSVSLETRVPFLDSDVIKFAAALPLEYKIRHGVTKWILRKVLYKYVPKNLIERPKMGFDVPLAEWLRGPLRGWAENLLDENRLKNEGFFDAFLVRNKWDEHISGKRNWHLQLWNVLMFQAWLENSR
jgi:asparagine synthase (glutamine-hydrolysing)